jgi:hypothetical protein
MADTRLPVGVGEKGCLCGWTANDYGNNPNCPVHGKEKKRPMPHDAERAVPEDLQQDYELTLQSLQIPNLESNSERVLGRIKEYIERIGKAEAEAAQLRKIIASLPPKWQHFIDKAAKGATQ